METPLSELLARHKDAYYSPIVPYHPETDRIIAMELGSGIDASVFHDTAGFMKYIQQKLSDAGARYAIGGYGELRNVYAGSTVFDADAEGSEPRRLHLGVDIWGAALTPVFAPLNGLVHSFAFNNRAGDYGATIILAHQLEGVSFYTLYGHLSLASIGNLTAGNRVKAGDIIASFGIPAENGQWPPHLHFQIIKDLQGYEGDYPGVCRNSEKDFYLSNCPDPELILSLRWEM